MKIIIKENNKVIAEIMTNKSLHLEEACELAGIYIMKTQEDFEQENGYEYDQLDIIA